MEKNMQNLKCNFCSEIKKDSDKAVVGPEVLICNDCIDLCNKIVENNMESRRF